MYQQIKPPQLRRSLSPTRLLLHLLLSLIIIVILPSLPPSSAVDYNTELYAACNKSTPFKCGEWEYSIQYPFLYTSDRPDYCGRPGYNLTCVRDSVPVLQAADKQYQVLGLDYSNRVLTLLDLTFSGGGPCSSSTPPLTNTSLDPALFNTDHEHVVDMTVINCTLTVTSLANAFKMCSSVSDGYQLYYSTADSVKFDQSCEIASIKITNDTELWPFSSSDILEVVTNGFNATWTAGSRSPCDEGCAQRNGICIYDDSSKSEKCMCSHGPCNGTGKRQTEAIATGVSVGAAFIIAALIGLLLLYRKRKRKIRSSAILSSRTGSTDPSSAKEAKEDLEFGTFPEPSISHYRTQVFTFEELRDATNGFSASNELGDGGFGTVYKGVLRDGRVVAVKQLYQQNYRRLEQFVNEVHLLSDLRHPNLVILYGCTSRHTRDLLLVYEYIPNGTVADHLYGTLADAGFMAWPIRMNIAIETADALRYLHEDGIQIIHRDVKTNNILLDNGFHVKVADFGLSRLFPLDATHVSTAPQGTPGYVDPEYHQCYQLTDKSDVYSFGVVLAELISSKPAVDITRQRSEINLANLTIKKIQNRELDQLVDPRLGYESDSRTREMIDSVAEVAFRCLQLEREMRPTMKEVLEELKRIRSGGIKAERGASEADAEVKEDTHLLKNPSLHSPTSVTERWASVATTPNASG